MYLCRCCCQCLQSREESHPRGQLPRCGCCCLRIQAWVSHSSGPAAVREPLPCCLLLARAEAAAAAVGCCFQELAPLPSSRKVRGVGGCLKVGRVWASTCSCRQRRTLRCTARGGELSRPQAWQQHKVAHGPVVSVHRHARWGPAMMQLWSMLIACVLNLSTRTHHAAAGACWGGCCLAGVADAAWALTDSRTQQHERQSR